MSSPDIAILAPDMRPGGAERVCLALADAFARDGLSVELVLRQARGELLEELPGGVSVHDLAAPRVRNALLPLADYLQKRRPRAMLAAMWPITSLAVWAKSAARAQTRIVTADHNILSLSRPGRPGLPRMAMRWAMRASYGRADAVVGVSDGVADDIAALSGLPRERITTIYNPITPLAAAQPADPAVMKAWGGGAKLITVGSLKAVKDHPTLLCALAAVRREREAKLLIVGDGAERPRIEALAAELGLTDAVVFAGFHPTPQTYVSQADAFVLSSRTEGLGNVLVEAMACGTPVISTDCPTGPGEILEGGRHGRLTPVGDPAALAAAILETLDAPTDRKALIARAEDFSIDKAAAAYRALLGV